MPLAALLIASCWTTPARTSSVELWRLDCGHFELRNINGRPRTVSNGRYLLRHGRDYMLWDAGLEEKLVGRPRVSESQALNLSRTLPTQFAEIGVQPERIGRIGVSYHHGDHLGQAARFPQATLLIGRKDWAEIRTNAAEASLMRPWLGRVTELEGDYNVFGGGSVVVDTPGPTLGHHPLLVHLSGRAVLLAGDAVHFRDRRATRQSSGDHFDKPAGVRSIDRMLEIARRMPARIVVQHDSSGIDELPAFPLAAA